MIPPSPVRILWEKTAKESAEFIESNLDGAMLFSRKEDLWRFSLSQANEDGLMIECGVYKAASLNYFAKNNPKKKFYGFDSFKGLQENWAGHHKTVGAFNLGGDLPKVESNVVLIGGWLKDTFKKFLEEKNTKISFLHIDTDTYSPAKLILETAKPYLKKGSVIVFDELYGYPGWRNGGEFKALNESFPDNSYDFIAFSNTQAAIRTA